MRPSLCWCVSAALMAMSLVQATDELQQHRSLMPWMGYNDESTWLTDIGGTPSWTVDFAGPTTHFLTTEIDVDSTDDVPVFSLKTLGTPPDGFSDLNSRIANGEMRIRVGNDDPLLRVVMTFKQPVKAWGATFRSADDAGDLDLTLTVICPGGEDITLNADDGFSGFILKDLAASSIIFRRQATNNDMNTVWIDNAMAVTGMKKSGSWGDPHFRTWGNQIFEYMGECDLVLLHVPNFERGMDLTVHVRTTIRYDYSFISSAAVRIGDEILELASYGDYILNGVELALPGATMMELAGFPVVHQKQDKMHERFDIIVGAQNITLAVFKDLVKVEVVQATAERFGNSTGLMGDYRTGHWLARDGTTVMKDANAFAQEWQVRASDGMLFQSIRAPQHPDQTCRLPSDAQAKGRRLGESKISKDEAEKACAHVAESDNKQACIFDVMATGDLDVADIY